MTTEPLEYRQHRFVAPPGATEILLVRHGESAPARLDQPFPLVDGHGDPPLDPVGVAQAERLADRLANDAIAAIYVTSLRRTVQTAAPLAARLGIEPRIERDLREVFLGEWEDGSFRKHAAEGHPLYVAAIEQERWELIPGAESADAFRSRLRAGLDRIVAAHSDEKVVVVSHAGVIGQLLAEATGSRGFAFSGADNGSISHVVVHGGATVLRTFNDTAHLL